MFLRDLLGRVQRQLASEGVPRRASADLRLLREIFTSRYQTILDAHPWSFLHVWSVMVVEPDYTTGTVTLTRGSKTVTGAGTAWTSGAHTGDYFMADGAVPIKIDAVASGTSLTLNTDWGHASLAGVGYRIRELVMLPGTGEVVSILGIWWKNRALLEKTLTFFDTLDPDRSNVGDPLYYATRGYYSDEGVRFEIFPYPSAGGMVRALFLRKPDLPSLDQVVHFPNPYLLEVGIRAGVYEYAFAETGEQRFMGMAQSLNATFVEALGALIEQDRVAASWPQSTPELDQPDLGDLDPLKHDTWPM